MLRTMHDQRPGAEPANGEFPMSSRECGPVTFFLLHGTFARRAGWTLDGSPLRKRLAASANDAGREFHFVYPPWTGRNHLRDRLAAAHDLASHIRALPPHLLTGAIFLIGHSHGGSVIAHCLQGDPSIGQHVTGSAFLSTPFYASRPKPYWKLMFRALLFCSAALLFLLVFLSILLWDAFYRIVAPSNLFYEFLPEKVWSEYLMIFDAMTLGFVSLLLAVCLYIVASRFELSTEKRLNHRVEVMQIANLMGTNHIFITVAGDEAAALLAGSQFITWMASLITFCKLLHSSNFRRVGLVSATSPHESFGICRRFAVRTMDWIRGDGGSE